MTLRAILALLVAAALLPSCLKDGQLPAPRTAEGPVDLRFELVAGMEPFSLGRTYLDGAGNMIRFTDLRFYLSGIHAYDDDGAMVADMQRAVVLVKGSDPVFQATLGSMPNGHIHELHFTGGVVQGQGMQGVGPGSDPLADPAMQGPDGLIHLLVEGYVDRDADGHYTQGQDLPFRFAPSGPQLLRDRHLHCHTDMIDGGGVLLGLRLDVRLLLLGLDLSAIPAEGLDAHYTALMNNLVAGITVRY